ncbi:hypothetical protein T484DRAFT_1984394, partial [Baffinella frigidus]
MSSVGFSILICTPFFLTSLVRSSRSTNPEALVLQSLRVIRVGADEDLNVRFPSDGPASAGACRLVRRGRWRNEGTRDESLETVLLLLLLVLPSLVVRRGFGGMFRKDATKSMLCGSVES